jgi:hypothetical protein
MSESKPYILTLKIEATTMHEFVLAAKEAFSDAMGTIEMRHKASAGWASDDADVEWSVSRPMTRAEADE